MNQDTVFAFQWSTFQEALEAWKEEQLQAYPHKSELIETVALAMEDFMESNQIRQHKMIISSTRTESD